MIKLIIRAATKFKLINRLNFYPSTAVNGQTVIVPIIKGIGQANLSISEIWMCDLMKILLAIKEGVFIDIGVNLGQTLIKLKSVNNNIRYIGFEPNPTCVFYVNDLIRVNKYANTSLFPVGIADKNQIIELNFYSQGDTDPGASIIKNFRPNSTVYRKEYIPCFNFESIQKELQADKISIVKIDVEGAESEVIKGILPLMSTARPFILIEILPVYNEENADRLRRQKGIEADLKQTRYKIYRIHKSGQNTLSKLEPLEEIGIHSKIEWSDYLLCPEEQAEKVIAGLR